MMQHLTLIRHGESTWNREGRIQGVRDCDLSELGREQAERLKERLDLEKIDVAYSSTAIRALETARRAVGHRLPVDARPHLREINLGVWEGELAAELKERFPVETSLWFRTPSKVQIEGGEPLRSFRRRVTRELTRIRRLHEEQGIVVFTHGGVICTYLTSLLGLKLDDLWRFKIRNGSITRLIFPNDEPRIEVLNDVGHLDGSVHQSPNTAPKYLR